VAIVDSLVWVKYSGKGILLKKTDRVSVQAWRLGGRIALGFPTALEVDHEMAGRNDISWGNRIARWL